MTNEFLFYSKVRYEEKQNQNNIDTQGIYNSSFWFGGEIKDRDDTFDVYIQKVGNPLDRTTPKAQRSPSTEELKGFK